MTTPVFLFSLPRSGSTLLQRLIATSPSIATASEPWLLLPLILGYGDGHVFASYQQRHLHQAFNDFLAQLPDGVEAHRAAVRNFAGTLYERAAGPRQPFFLDKTPRYHLIATEILKTFPESPAILLWRHPLAVGASAMNTWCRGRWNLYHYRVDLYHGIRALLAAQEAFPERLLVIRYEDLTAHPERQLAKVFEHIGVPAEPEATRRFADVALDGQMGDPADTAPRRDIAADPKTPWPEAFATPLRRAWARRYLRWLGRERLALMGYKLDASLDQLAATPVRLRHAFSDAARMVYGRYAIGREAALFRRKRHLARQGPRIDVASE